MSCEGFGNGMKTFFPDFFNSLSDFGNSSGYLEFNLHLPQQQCLVITISWSSSKLTTRIYFFYPFSLTVLPHPLVYLHWADHNACLSLSGRSKWQNLFLVIVQPFFCHHCSNLSLALIINITIIIITMIIHKNMKFMNTNRYINKDAAFVNKNVWRSHNIVKPGITEKKCFDLDSYSSPFSSRKFQAYF